MSEEAIPAYLIVQLDVKNHEEYLERYGTSVMAIFERIGAEVVGLSMAPKALEGEWAGNWTVIVRFPSMASAEDWYDSAEYRPLKELRTNQLTDGGSVLLVEGFNPAALR